MPHTRFSRQAENTFEDHRDADLALIETIMRAVADRQICDQEIAAIKGAIAEVVASAGPVAGFLTRQDQAFRTIQLIANTGGMTNWVDEQLRSMAADRACVPAPVPDPVRTHSEGPAATGPSSNNGAYSVAS